MTWHPDMPLEYRNQIVTGDARELAKRIPDESIDLIFTDPPYLGEYLPLYDWLFEYGARALKPTGFLMTYVGGYHLDTVMAKARQHLDFFWQYWMQDTANSVVMWPRRTITRGKAILCYRVPGQNAMPKTNVLGVWVGGGDDKRYHVWGQDESTARYYIDCFTRLGDIVADPFTGGGTVPAVCKMLGRNYVASEIDPDVAERARQRVLNTQPPLFVLQPEQLTLEV